MRRSWVVVGASLLITASASRAQDEQARMAVNQAFARQKALPGYVEHQFGCLPVEPGGVETLADMVTARVKEKATEKLQEKVAQATAHAPLAAELSDRALTLLDAQADAELVIPMGPEREIVTVEHSGTRERQVLADGRGEVVRGGGQMAYKYTVPAQATATQLAASVQSTAEVAKEARSTIASIKAFSSALAKGGTGDILGAAMAGFDEVIRLLHGARSTRGAHRRRPPTCRLFSQKKALAETASQWLGWNRHSPRIDPTWQCVVQATMGMHACTASRS
jgi:hypothetical protein